ncbi:MAG TPA: autotransporter outer membrane beta-barrel domain-containing protein [Chitinophagaceae bacterium]|nr:autotransporter outer membrane beta-barrel domain-containing protein [Chitinophagaceae bacterium]
MKTRMLICLAIVFVSLQSFAQGKTKGFYINPNLSFSSGYGYYLNKKVNFSPQLSVGYLWGNTNRHNFSLTTLQVRGNRNSNAFGIGLKYNYDILLYRQKRLSLFVSPFVKVNSNFTYSKYANSASTYKNRTHNYQIQMGVSPTIEYKLGKRVDFVMSTPINAISLYKSKSTSINNDVKVSNEWSGFQTRPSVEANLGIRINLFKKK